MKESKLVRKHVFFKPFSAFIFKGGRDVDVTFLIALGHQTVLGAVSVMEQ